jgi:hypothetical protein
MANETSLFGGGAEAERKLSLKREPLQELSAADLAKIVGGVTPQTKCACATDWSNSCCGPNGSC